MTSAGQLSYNSATPPRLSSPPSTEKSQAANGKNKISSKDTSKNASNDSGLTESKPSTPLTPIESSNNSEQSSNFSSNNSSSSSSGISDEQPAVESFNQASSSRKKSLDVERVEEEESRIVEEQPVGRSAIICSEPTSAEPGKTPNDDTSEPVNELGDLPRSGRGNQKKCQSSLQQGQPATKSQSFADAQSFAKSHQKRATEQGGSPTNSQSSKGSSRDFAARARSVDNNDVVSGSVQLSKGRLAQGSSSNKPSSKQHNKNGNNTNQKKATSKSNNKESNLSVEQHPVAGKTKHHQQQHSSDHQHPSTSSGSGGGGLVHNNSSSSIASSLSNRGNSSSHFHHNHNHQQQSSKHHHHHQHHHHQQQQQVKLGTLVRQCRGKLASVLGRAIQNSLSSYNTRKFAGLLITLFTMFAMLLAIFIHLYIIAPVAEL